MKNFVFLFDNIIIFYWVAGVVVLNAIIGIYIAIKEKTFSWSKSTDFIRTLALYCLWLIIGNAVDYFTKLQGIEVALLGFDIGGFKLLSTAIAAKEIGGLFVKMKKLQPLSDPKPDDKK